MISFESLKKADINISTSGNNTIIAAPGDGKYLAIDFIQFMAGGTVTVQMKDGTTNYGGSYSITQGQGITVENTMSNEHGVITLANNSAFVLNLSDAVQVSGFIRYRIVG